MKNNLTARGEKRLVALEKEFQYYLDHQAELVKKYNGKVVVIKDCEVIGAYDDDARAVTETQEDHELGTFLVQKCTPGKEGYTVTFHSRVAL